MEYASISALFGHAPTWTPLGGGLFYIIFYDGQNSFLGRAQTPLSGGVHLFILYRSDFIKYHFDFGARPPPKLRGGEFKNLGESSAESSAPPFSPYK